MTFSPMGEIILVLSVTFWIDPSPAQFCGVHQAEHGSGDTDSYDD